MGVFRRTGVSGGICHYEFDGAVKFVDALFEVMERVFSQCVPLKNIVYASEIMEKF